MVGTTTREGRAERWRFFNVVAAVVLALSTVQFVAIADATAQVTKVPAKKITKVIPKSAAKQAPADGQEADQLNAKWLADHNAAEAAAVAPTAGTTPSSAPVTSAASTAPVAG